MFHDAHSNRHRGHYGESVVVSVADNSGHAIAATHRRDKQTCQRAVIQQFRQRQSAIPPPQVLPQWQRASDTSLLRRLRAATARIRQLEVDNHELRDALARALTPTRRHVAQRPDHRGQRAGR